MSRLKSSNDTQSFSHKKKKSNSRIHEYANRHNASPTSCSSLFSVFVHWRVSRFCITLVVYPEQTTTIQVDCENSLSQPVLKFLAWWWPQVPVVITRQQRRKSRGRSTESATSAKGGSQGRMVGSNKHRTFTQRTAAHGSVWKQKSMGSYFILLT